MYLDFPMHRPTGFLVSWRDDCHRDGEVFGFCGLSLTMEFKLRGLTSGARPIPYWTVTVSHAHHHPTGTVLVRPELWLVVCEAYLWCDTTTGRPNGLDVVSASSLFEREIFYSLLLICCDFAFSSSHYLRKQIFTFLCSSPCHLCATIRTTSTYSES